MENFYHVGDQPLNSYKKGARIIAQNGIHIVRDNPLFRAIVPAKSIPDLEKIEPECTWQASLFPFSLIKNINNFFLKVHQDKKTEAMLQLTYHNEIWGVIPPKSQRVESAHVSFDPDPRGNAGTIHSHHVMTAHFSHTDDKDDIFEGVDGVHIVLGKIYNPVPEIAVSVTVGGIRFEFKELDQVISGLPKTEISDDIPEEWIKSIEEPREQSWLPGFPGQGNYQGHLETPRTREEIRVQNSGFNDNPYHFKRNYQNRYDQDKRNYQDKLVTMCIMP